MFPLVLLGALLMAIGGLWFGRWPGNLGGLVFPIGKTRTMALGTETSRRVREIGEPSKHYRSAPGTEVDLTRLPWPGGNPLADAPRSRISVLGRGLTATIVRVEAELVGDRLIIAAAAMPRVLRLGPSVIGLGLIAVGIHPRLGMWVFLADLMMFLCLAAVAWRRGRQLSDGELDRIEGAFRK